MIARALGGLVVALLCAAPTASASEWVFTPGTPCLLEHSAPTFDMTLTYDPTAPLYTLSVTRQTGFVPSQTFAMRFDGPVPIQIATDRHILSADGKTLTVEDSGFGNVLNGLQFNQTAMVFVDALQLPIDLKGASEPVAAFRVCDVRPAV